MKNPKNMISEKQIVSFLATTEIFSSLPEKKLKELASHIEVCYLPGEQILFNQYSSTNCFYIVMFGHLEAIQTQDGNKHVLLGEMAPGSVIGEIAFLIDVKRRATIYAVRDSILLKIAHTSCDELIRKYPEVFLRITQHSIKRLIHSHRPQVKRKTTYFTLVPASNYQDLLSFSELFVKQLECFGKTIFLSSTYFDMIHGKEASQMSLDSAKSAEIMTWLHQLEEEYQFIVYMADKHDDWAERCIRQSDKILLIADHADSHQLNELETYIFKADKNKESKVHLVLVYPSAITLPSHTNKWFKNRYIKQYYNIRKGNAKDLSRFTRLITGNGVGLVLGGGGARALAHIGLIKALEELEIPIDYIGGTSMGALIGACLALELDYNFLSTSLLESIGQFAKKRDYTLPLSALFKGKLLTKLLEDCYGNSTTIENLWIKYFCISTNLSLYQLNVHDSDLLWKAVRCSISLPAIFPAMHNQENHILVDGGVLNNLPVDIMEQLINHGQIISSSLKVQENVINGELENDTCSGWYLFLKHILLPKIWPKAENQKKQFVTINQAIVNSITLASLNHQKLMQTRANYNVIMDIGDYGLLEFEKMHKIIDIGYSQALAALENTPLIKNQ
jgi:NTE family protein